MDGSGNDVCHVGGGQIEKCVKMASMPEVREIIHKERMANIGPVDAVINEMNVLKLQLEPIIQRYISLLARRQRYKNEIAKIKDMRKYLEQLISTLHGNIDTIDVFKDKVKQLKQLYLDIKKEYEDPVADCTGMPGYEKDVEGDGLVGKYYDNLQWKGEAVEQVHKQVRFFWASEQPAEGVGANDFTAEYAGYLKVPVTGEYTFECEADDGCKVLLNNSQLINDSMPPDNYDDLLVNQRKVMDEKSMKGEFQEFVKPLMPDDPPRFPRQNRSDSVMLEEGQYYSINIFILHSVHNSVFEDGNAYLYLRWESNMIQKQVIPGTYLFTKDFTNQSKPSGYDANNFLLENTKEGDWAFMDSKAFIMKYIPIQFVGKYILKSKISNEIKQLQFVINSNVKVTVAYPASITSDPLGTDWKSEPTGFSLLKYLPKYESDLKLKKLVASSTDISMKMKTKSFYQGTIRINMMVDQPLYFMVIIGSTKSQSDYSCAGEEINVTKSNIYSSCSAEGTSAANECSEAFVEDKFWLPTDDPTFMSIQFAEDFKPTRIVYKLDPKTNSRPQVIKVFYNDTVFEELQIVGADFNFVLEQAIVTSKLRFEIDTGTAGVYFEVYGVRCFNHFDEERHKKELAMKKLGIQKQIKQISASCNDTLADMQENELIVNCTDICLDTLDGFPAFYKVNETDNYLNDSTVCSAARNFYKDDDSVLKKNTYAVKKIKDPDDKSNFYIQFDHSLMVKLKNFKPEQEVDIMDIERCYIRGRVKKVFKDFIKIEYQSQEISVKKENVFKCGEKLPSKICGSSENLIRIKFCKGGQDLDNCRKVLTSVTYFDTGEIMGSKLSGGALEYGWSEPNPSRMIIVSGASSITNSKKLYNGTSAVMSDSIPGSWAIKVVNGHYRLNLKLKLVHPETEPKGNFELKINNVTKKGKIVGNYETLVQVSKLKVTNGEIRITRISGYVSMVELDIEAKPEPKQKEPVTEIKTKSGHTAFLNCSYTEINTDCVFEPDAITEVKCSGYLTRVPSHEIEEVACKYICLKPCTAYLADGEGCERISVPAASKANQNTPNNTGDNQQTVQKGTKDQKGEFSENSVNTRGIDGQGDNNSSKNSSLGPVEKSVEDYMKSGDNESNNVIDTKKDNLNHLIHVIKTIAETIKTKSDEFKNKT